MPFPQSPRLVFEENTLTEVICQLRFPPVLTILTEPPSSFQESIRDSYPLYRRQDPFSQLPENLSGVLSELPLQRPLNAITHTFETEDSHRSISLTSEFVAITERDYVEWDLMVKEIERAKAALEEIYRPSFYTRIGLRYRNIVRKGALNFKDRAWKDLLNPAFTGMLGADDIDEGDVSAIRSECVIDLTPGTPQQVRVLQGLEAESSGQTYLIDADYFTTERSGGDSVRNTLDEFNRQSGYLFRWAIRPTLRDALRPRSVEP
jgi:uncharacterized protein (TIGR04255 family)